MSVINSPKAKIMNELKKQFPRMRIMDDVADVLLAGRSLNAVSEASKKTKWVFIRQGAKDGAFDAAYKKYGLLDKKETEQKVYFEYKRPFAQHPKNNAEILAALELERRRLYTHLLANSGVKAAVMEALSLSSGSLELIRRTLEQGSIYEQLNKYKKVLNFLTTKGLYDKRYDYYVIGFRNVPHHYWLSKSALKILSDAK
ncbi:MAG: hypothetical protein QXN55_02150 [Candidatus Nitrosotenuis sp.]